MKKLILAFFAIIASISIHAQLPDSCKLSIGTNMSGLYDWSTELPFVDMMHHARQWYTKSVDDAEYPWNSEKAKELSYRSDGYPTHIPQSVNTSNYQQQVATIWAITDAWPKGTYTVLVDGAGEIDITGAVENFTKTDDHRYTFDMVNPENGAVEMIITESKESDPIRNIRVLMPGTEYSYQEEPFYDKWVEKVSDFPTLRFMDWGQTNNWGNEEAGTTSDFIYLNWAERSKMDHYTWANSKGIPYEMMIRLMNHLDKDGWVCVPHRAGEEYQKNMAALFLENLEEERHLYVEYSNEIWNWIFDQTHWLNKWGCEANNMPWPEGIVPFVQNTMDYWTEVYAGDMDRLTRVVGAFVAWLDVSERIAYNLRPNSFDAISPTFYIGLTEEQDAELDQLGNSATVDHIIDFALENIPEVLSWIDGINGIADSLDKKMVFYEGGQHLTPHPFGVEPTYGQALIDAQRSPRMYELYNVWLDALRRYQKGDTPLLLMSFGFIGQRSAQYGSWGILESINQDTSEIPAPKYRAILDNMAQCSEPDPTLDHKVSSANISVYPNPTRDLVIIDAPLSVDHAILYDIFGRLIAQIIVQDNSFILPRDITDGMYIARLFDHKNHEIGSTKINVMK